MPQVFSPSRTMMSPMFASRIARAASATEAVFDSVTGLEVITLRMLCAIFRFLPLIIVQPAARNRTASWRYPSNAAMVTLLAGAKAMPMMTVS
jgi:hypothetical protein